jgi:transaldolase|tara:strand:+ start:1434 stop:2030 length:597 start_codon:yes stop_codon:yes gene_type:complete
MRKAKAKNYEEYSKKILRITKKPISFEVFADDEKGMINQGKKISEWGNNVYVKVPITNSKGKFSGKVIKKLNSQKIKLNITAVYTASQTKQILKNINKKTKVIISIFAGRMGDVGKDPIPEFKKSIYMAKKYKNVEILWASTREPYNFIQAKNLGCQIITIPPSMIDKINKFGKSFQKLTSDTVKGFLLDSIKSKFKI